MCFLLSTSDELSHAWLLTLTESDCTVVLQQKCYNATLIIFISTAAAAAAAAANYFTTLANFPYLLVTSVLIYERSE